MVGWPGGRTDNMQKCRRVGRRKVRNLVVVAQPGVGRALGRQVHALGCWVWVIAWGWGGATWRPHPPGILILSQHSLRERTLGLLFLGVLRFWCGQFEILVFVNFLFFFVFFGWIVSVKAGRNNQPHTLSSLGDVRVPGGLWSQHVRCVCGANVLTPLVS